MSDSDSSDRPEHLVVSVPYTSSVVSGLQSTELGDMIALSDTSRMRERCAMSF
jgi:hypothetical protein